MNLPSNTTHGNANPTHGFVATVFYRHTENNMVCAKDDQTLCAIRDVRPDAEQKRFSVTVRPHYTVAALYRDVRLQASYSDFELNLLVSDSEETVSLHEKQEEKLSDVGIKLGTTNNLTILPRNNSHHLMPQEDLSSDDDLALGASASPDESGNYNIPVPPALPPPLDDSATKNHMSRFNINIDPSKNSGIRAIGAPPAHSMSGGSIISNGFHHGDGGGGSDGGGGVGRGKRTVGDGDCDRAPTFRGLVNQAMTCYLNSLLQGLYMTPEFRNALYNWEFDGEDEAKSIPYQLQKLFVNLQTSPKSAVETTDLTRSFGWDSAEGWQQHDIQELCRVMFDALEHKFKRTEQADLINRLYQGHMIDYVKCLECNTEKQREDKFLDIPLPVRPFGSIVANESVEAALQGFVKPEILNESNQYFCDKCNKKCDAHKGLKFTKFPYILTLHLKRFDFDYQSFHRIKLNDKVTFPELLNLNHFVSSCSSPSSEYKLTTSTVAAAECASANGSMMMETAENFMKSDECSTTDSGSALEEDSFQNGGTSVSSTTTTPNDHCMTQDDDEGIDMELAGNGESNGKSSALNNSFNAPGPYKYELFAIMIHAGSASGGHYYAYIKDFKSGRWFSFNDQTVQPITQDDIHKSFGGGSYKTSYTGAYTSSTNAYMLMYRQIDGEKNALPISEEKFPEHIRRLVMKIRSNEGNHSRDHLDMTRITVWYENPCTQVSKGQRLAVFTSSTLAETVQEAIRIHHLKGTVPVERCRLVGFDGDARVIERSFEGHEDKSIEEVMRMMKRGDALLLETREEGETFEEYLVQGVMTKVYKVDVNGRDVEGPLSIRANLRQTVAQYRSMIARKMKLNAKTLMLGMNVHKEGPKVLQTDTSSLEEEHFIEFCKVFVTTAPPADDAEQYVTRFRKFIQRLDHLIALYMPLPNMEPETLKSMAIPRLSKEALASLAGADSSAATGDSNSEDSSLSDNDRTLVEDGFGHIKLNGDLHLANGGATANGTSNGTKRSTTSTKKINNGFLDDDDDDEEEDEDAKLAEMLKGFRTLDYYFKVTTLEPATGTNGGSSSSSSNASITASGNGSADDGSTRKNGSDTQKLIQVLIDKRACNAYLKYRLQAYLQIPMDYIKVLAVEPASQTNDLPKEIDFKDGDHVVIKLGRVLRKGEYKLNVHYINVNDMTDDNDNGTFLCSTIVRRGELVGQVKADILASLPAKLGDGYKKYAHLHSNNTRLRRRGIKYPSFLYRDDEVVRKNYFTTTTVEVYLQEVDDLASLTPMDDNDVIWLIRRWHPKEMKLGKFQEILITDKLDVQKQFSRISGIPEGNIEYVKIQQSSLLHRENVLTIHNSLDWRSPKHDDSTTFIMGTLLYYRDRTEQLKELTPEERKELTKKDNRTSSTYSPRKERALKIYLDASPKKADD